MAFVHADRVKELSTTTGTGALSLGGATAGFRSFAAGVGVGNECFYGIVHTLDNTWEVGRGTVGAGTFSRDTVFSSTNSNLLVNFAAGDKIVFTTNPAEFYTNALDATSHAGIDHTLAPLNLLDAPAHSTVDHTAAPLNLLNVTGHEGVDHTIAPFNLLDVTGHQGVDHTIAPFNLLNSTLHNSIDHTTAPLSLLSQAAHLALDHSAIPGVGEDNPTQVSPAERTAGTETALRSYSPFDIADMAATHGTGGGTIRFIQQVFATPVTSVVSCSTVLPDDDTIPQISEGTLVISATITPQSISNTLAFRFSCSGAKTIGGTKPYAILFQGAGPGALAVSGGTIEDSGRTIVTLDHYFTAPSSGAPITFNIYIGIVGGGTFHVNGDSAGTREFGGVQAARLTIAEIAP